MLLPNIFWRCHRHRYKCFILILVQCILVLCMKYYFSYNKTRHSSLKRILYWAIGGEDVVVTCAEYVCLLSEQRAGFSTADAVIFHASNMNLTDMPVPRSPHQLWALLHEESPQNLPPIKYDALMRHFNITSTISQYSDYPLTTNNLGNAAELYTDKYMLPISTKNLLRTMQAPILFLQSNCETMTRRTQYVLELMKYIPIDSYGECQQNRRPPPELTGDYLNRLYEPSVLSFLARYKFILAIENGVCYDYITEKFWRPLVVGAIPIYFGAPNIRDWEPNNHSAIHIRDFASAKELAQYIIYLDKNDAAYDTYFQHKYDKITPIANKRLHTALLHRNYFEGFFCGVCRELHKMPPNQRRIANQSHYDCPWPLTSLPLSTSPTPPTSAPDYWKLVFEHAELEAKAYSELLQRNKRYDETDVRKLLKQYVEKN